MADSQHLAKLREGVEAWNQWRTDNPLVRPDLTEANLTEANLSKAYLRRADLFRAKLRGANLREANLSEAHLREADLIGANLIGANVSTANLSMANLSMADLSDADLSGADLSGAKLTGATLTGAKLREAKLREADLCLAILPGADLFKADLSLALLLEAKLTRANLAGANLAGANIGGADLSGADLFRADLTHAALDDVRITRSTLAQNARFGKDHDEFNDGADTLRLSRFTSVVNWSSLRFLSEVPLFGVSYAALGLLFVFVHGVDVANTMGLQKLNSGLEEFSKRLAEIPPKLDEIRAEHPTAADYLDSQINAAAETIRGLESAVRGFSSQLPTQLTLPDETFWALVSAVLLVLGTTVYRLFCPPSVKRFSEIEWVAQLRRPRLLHIADSLACGPPVRRRWHVAFQICTGASVGIGGAIAIVLLAIRIWKLFQLVLAYKP